MHNQNSPNSDGFTVELNKQYWPLLKTQIDSFLNTSYTNGKLSHLQSQGSCL